MIVQLFSAVVFAIFTVLAGWAMGHVGWISLALYSAGGLFGFAMVYPVLLMLGLRLHPSEDGQVQDIRELAA